MKRSEMIEKLIDLVYMSSSDDLCLTKGEANYILTGLEELGMLPPKAPIKLGPYETYDYYWENETKGE